MIIELIAMGGVIIIVASYFLLAKRFPKLRSILIGAAGALALVSLLTSKSLSIFVKKSADEIAKSKANDKDRDKVIKKTEEQIKRNKELIDEIKKVLSSNNSLD